MGLPGPPRAAWPRSLLDTRMSAAEHPPATSARTDLVLPGHGARPSPSARTSPTRGRPPPRRSTRAGLQPRPHALGRASTPHEDMRTTCRGRRRPGSSHRCARRAPASAPSTSPPPPVQPPRPKATHAERPWRRPPTPMPIQVQTPPTAPPRPTAGAGSRGERARRASRRRSAALVPRPEARSRRSPHGHEVLQRFESLRADPGDAHQVVGRAERAVLSPIADDLGRRDRPDAR